MLQVRSRAACRARASANAVRVQTLPPADAQCSSTRGCSSVLLSSPTIYSQPWSAARPLSRPVHGAHQLSCTMITLNYHSTATGAGVHCKRAVARHCTLT
eukprot:1924599-Pleurochrysis_carterae.AAC.1